MVCYHQNKKPVIVTFRPTHTCTLTHTHPTEGEKYTYTYEPMHILTHK